MTKPSLGEISTIRDILMGEQMTEYDSRFQQLNERLNAAEERINNRIDELQARQEAALQQLRKDTEARLEALSQQLGSKSGELEERINTVSRNDRVRLGEMLSELGKQISSTS